MPSHGMFSIFLPSFAISAAASLSSFGDFANSACFSSGMRLPS